MTVRYRVELSEAERQELHRLIAGGKAAVRRVKRAQILLAADAGRTDEEIAAAVVAGTSTVYRTKRRFVEGNLEYALSEAQRPGAHRKLSRREEALLVAHRLLHAAPGAGALDAGVAGRGAGATDRAYVALPRDGATAARGERTQTWRKDMWCIPCIDGEFVARMEDVLDLYAEPADPAQPVVCFDESPTQLIGEVRPPLAAKRGQLARYDCEYRRNGTANLFVFLDVHRPWRHVKVTEHRTSVDFAQCMRELVDVHYPQARRIRVVLDNLSTHAPGALYDAFPPEEARRVLRRLEFHHTPKHASWLNMVEIEIGVLRCQCLDRRIGEWARLEAEIAAWEHARNASGARIRWMFTAAKARQKMRNAYPEPAQYHLQAAAA